LLTGELDLASAPQLQDCLGWLASNGLLHVVLDLANVTFINSTGISVFVTALKRMEPAGGSLIIRNASSAAFRLFEITGLVDFLSVRGIEKTAGVATVSSARRFATPSFGTLNHHTTVSEPNQRKA
jgi:anti-anti-sigma factor